MGGLGGQGGGLAGGRLGGVWGARPRGFALRTDPNGRASRRDRPSQRLPRHGSPPPKKRDTAEGRAQEPPISNESAARACCIE